MTHYLPRAMVRLIVARSAVLGCLLGLAALGSPAYGQSDATVPSITAGQTNDAIGRLLGAKLAPASSFRTASECVVETQIQYGQTVNGDLAATDCLLDDGTYADLYYFQGAAGDKISIKLSSKAFIPFMGLFSASDQNYGVIGSDGGSGSTTLQTTLPSTGSYFILVNSLDPATGSYTLSLTGAPPCTYTFSPLPAPNVPHTGGTFNVNVFTRPDCSWTAVGQTFEVTANGSGTGNGTFTYTVIPNDRNQVRRLMVWVDTARYDLIQERMPCNYSLAPAEINIGPDSATGSFYVTSPAGCSWGVFVYAICVCGLCDS
jgi:hypothetical protein